MVVFRDGGTPNFDAEELAVLKAMGIDPSDPAAGALIDRIVEIRGLREHGDPGFQPDAPFFKRTGIGGRPGRMVAGGLSALDQLLAGGGGDIDDVLDLGGGFGGGGGGRAVPFGSTRVGIEAANAFAAAEAEKDRQFQIAQAEKARQFERAQELERLKAERERIFTDMLGTDPVRAVLFALGVGGEILPGGDRFADLAALPGAEAQRGKTETALSQLIGNQVQVGRGGGVTGLGPAAQAAAAFGGQAGGTGGNIADQQKLLLSGFGVGARRGKGRPGQSREETIRQISSVTPQGVL